MSRTKDIHSEAFSLLKQSQVDKVRKEGGGVKVEIKTESEQQQQQQEDLVDTDVVSVGESEERVEEGLEESESVSGEGIMKDIGTMLMEGHTEAISHPGTIESNSILNNFGSAIGKVLVLPVNPPQPTMTGLFGEHMSNRVVVKPEPASTEQNITISHMGNEQYINVYPTNLQISVASSSIPISLPIKQEKTQNVLPSIDDMNFGILATKTTSSSVSVKTELSDSHQSGMSKDIKQIVTFLKEEPKQTSSSAHSIPNSITSTVASTFATSYITFPKKEGSDNGIYGIMRNSQIPTPAPIPSISTVLQQSTKNIAVGTQVVDIKPLVSISNNVQKVAICPEDIKDITTIIEEDIKSTRLSPVNDQKTTTTSPVHVVVSKTNTTVRIPNMGHDHTHSDSEDTIIDIGMPNEDIMDIPMSPKGDIMDIVMSPKGDIMDTSKHSDPVATAVASAGIIDLPDDDIIDIAMSPEMDDIIYLASSPDDEIIDIAMSSEDDNGMMPPNKKQKLTTIAESDVFNVSDESNKSELPCEDVKLKLKKKCINRNKQILPEHSATKLQPYTCTRCGNGFAKRDLLVRHLPCNVNVTERPFSCSNCGRGFTKKELLVKHLPCKANDKYCCTICGNGFAWKKLLQKHALTCEKEFFSKHEADQLFNINDDNTKVYIKDSHPTQPFVCQICGKRSNRRYNMKKHVLTHKPDLEKFSELYIRDGIGSKPYQCKMCGHRSTSAILIQQHVLIMHYKKNQEGEASTPTTNGTENIKFQCKSCDRETIFSEKCCLMDHMHRMHNPNNLQPAQAFTHDNNAAKPYRCTICTFDFVTKSAILNHAACLHNKPPPSLPDEDVASESDEKEEEEDDEMDIATTVAVTTAEKQILINPNANEELTNSLFQCKVCQRYFPTKQGVQQHVLSHVKHTCDICGLEFKWKNALKKHMEDHVANPTSPTFVQTSTNALTSKAAVVSVQSTVQAVQSMPVSVQSMQQVQTVSSTLQTVHPVVSAVQALQTVHRTIKTAQAVQQVQQVSQANDSNIPVLTNQPLLCQTPNANVIVQQVPQMSQASHVTLQNSQAAMVTVQYMPQQAQGGGSIFTIQHVPQQQTETPTLANVSASTNTTYKQEPSDGSIIKQEVPAGVKQESQKQLEIHKANPITFTIKNDPAGQGKQDYIATSTAGISIQISGNLDKSIDKATQYMQIPSDFEPKEGGLYINDTHEKQPYLCKSCGYRSSRRYNIRRHVWSKHTSPSYKTKFSMC